MKIMLRLCRRELLRNKAIQALTLGLRLHNQPPVQGWFHTHDEFAAEFLFVKRLGQFVPIGIYQGDYFFDRLLRSEERISKKLLALTCSKRKQPPTHPRPRKFTLGLPGQH